MIWTTLPGMMTKLLIRLPDILLKVDVCIWIIESRKLFTRIFTLTDITVPLHMNVYVGHIWIVLVCVSMLLLFNQHNTWTIPGTCIWNWNRVEHVSELLNPERCFVSGHNKTIDEFDYTDADITYILFDCMSNIHFTGVGADVSLSLDSRNPDETMRIERVQSKHWRRSESFNHHVNWIDSYACVNLSN